MKTKGIREYLNILDEIDDPYNPATDPSLQAGAAEIAKPAPAPEPAAAPAAAASTPEPATPPAASSGVEQAKVGIAAGSPAITGKEPAGNMQNAAATMKAAQGGASPTDAAAAGVAAAAPKPEAPAAATPAPAVNALGVATGAVGANPLEPAPKKDVPNPPPAAAAAPKPGETTTAADGRTYTTQKGVMGQPDTQQRSYKSFGDFFNKITGKGDVNGAVAPTGGAAKPTGAPAAPAGASNAASNAANSALTGGASNPATPAPAAGSDTRGAAAMASKSASTPAAPAGASNTASNAANAALTGGASTPGGAKPAAPAAPANAASNNAAAALSGGASTPKPDTAAAPAPAAAPAAAAKPAEPMSLGQKIAQQKMNKPPRPGAPSGPSFSSGSVNTDAVYETRIKSFAEYLYEAELFEDIPTAGDRFDIEIAREEIVLESVVVGYMDDGIIVEADDTMMRILEHVGYLTENPRNMPPATDTTSPIHGGNDRDIDEAEYHGRSVPLGKPMKGDVKKSKVYVKNAKGNVVKVNFGDPNMTIKKSNPKRRKSFRARHHCENPGPRTSARYWSCRAW